MIKEFLYFFNGLKELYNLVYYEYGDKNLIHFENIVDFTLNKLKNLQNLSFQLNQHQILISRETKPQNEKYLT